MVKRGEICFEVVKELFLPGVFFIIMKFKNRLPVNPTGGIVFYKNWGCRLYKALIKAVLKCWDSGPYPYGE